MEGEMEVAELPADFRCPISLEVMTDPVILSSGHTFDRSSIQRWLDSGNLTCPVTNLPLPPSPSLIPNHALRRLISSFLARRPPPSADADADDAFDDYQHNESRRLFTRLSFPSDAASLSGVLRLAQRGGSAARSLILDSGVVACVLLPHVAASDRPDLQDLALRVLLHLSLEGDDARLGLVAEGAIDPVVAALVSSSSASLAATLLTSLAVVEVNKATIGAHPLAIPRLAALLRDGGARERRESATALYELCKFADNRRRTSIAGTVPPLLLLAREGSERAVRLLSLLSRCREGKDEMINTAGFAAAMTEAIRTGTVFTIEHALSVLNLVSSESKAVALEAIKEGILDLCSAFSCDLNQKTRKNAKQLIFTLQNARFQGFP
ncbi:U-box domain-containing protein 8-like [Curcuma longa]|uniref:U-box domain-containing protein 8-like n=1 Tax=Curcuma longa TaxID=136217 RepID=UPI003D9EBB2B